MAIRAVNALALPALVVASLIATAFVADRAFPWLDAQLGTGLLLNPPGQLETVRVSEDGSVTYRTNKGGLRGSEVSLTKPSSCRRIAMVGDSFVFGVGVDEEETYPALVARALRAGRNQCVEALNFGVPGTDPLRYVGIVQAAGPYEPDIVVISVYVGDDLVGLFADSWRDRVTRQLAYLFPAVYSAVNTYRARASYRAAARVAALDGLRQAAFDLGARLGLSREEVSARWARLPADLVDDVGRRAVWPRLVLVALVNPDFYLENMLLTGSRAGQALAVAERALDVTVTSARRPSTLTVLVAIPDALQVDPGAHAFHRHLGFRTTETMLESARPQAFLREFARARGVLYVDLLPEFRRRRGEGLYLVSDNHWTWRGHALAGRLVGEALAAELSATKER